MALRKYCQTISQKDWWGSPFPKPRVAVKLNFCGLKKQHWMGLPFTFSYRTQMWVIPTVACQPWSFLRCLINTGITSHVSEMWPPLRRRWQHWATGREEHFSHWNWDKGCLERTGGAWVSWCGDSMGTYSYFHTVAKTKEIKNKSNTFQSLLFVYSASELYTTHIRACINLKGKLIFWRKGRRLWEN